MWPLWILFFLYDVSSLLRVMTRLPLYVSTRIGNFSSFMFLPFFVTNNFFSHSESTPLFPSTTIATCRRTAATVITSTRKNEERLETCLRDTSQAPGMFFTTSRVQNATKTGTTRSRARWTRDRLETCLDASRAFGKILSFFFFFYTLVFFSYIFL
jgi:hypothetical protein